MTATTASENKSKNNSSVGQGDIKPTTKFIPPPISAIITLLLFVSTSIYYLPPPSSSSSSKDDFNDDDDDDDDKLLFTKRVFPQLISFEVLFYTRLVFTLVCFGGFMSAWIFPPITVNTPYRPQSRCPRIPFTLNGFGKQFPFTAVSWNLLGITYALMTYIGYIVEYKGGEQIKQQQQQLTWLIPLTRIMWEISAPMTLLIGCVVKYALWPAQLEKIRKENLTSNDHVFKTFRALLQHNANVIMAATEIALLGGVPVRLNYMSIPILYGCAYIIFSYSIQLTWHKQGPAFIYFFFDTSLGNEHTLALYVLLAIMCIFYCLFVGCEYILEMLTVGNDNNTMLDLTTHIVFVICISALVCRWRD